MKAAIALSLLGCVFGFSGKAFAGDAWGPCTPVDGTTYHYNVDVDVGVPDASKNVAGTVLTDVMNWSNGQNVSIICECPDSYKNEKDTLIQGVSAIANMTKDIGGFKYYYLTDELSVSTKIQVSSGQYGFVPFKGQQALQVTGCNEVITTPYMGGGGLLSFLITKPFIGDSVIPPTLIAELYASKTNKDYGTIPISSVSIQGRVTITQDCEIKPGTVLMCHLVNSSSAFKNRQGKCLKVRQSKKLTSALIATISRMVSKSRCALRGQPMLTIPERWIWATPILAYW